MALERRNVFQYEDDESILLDEEDYGIIENATKISEEENVDFIDTLVDLSAQWAESVDDTQDIKTRARAFVNVLNCSIEFTSPHSAIVHLSPILPKNLIKNSVPTRRRRPVHGVGTGRIPLFGQNIYGPANSVPRVQMLQENVKRGYKIASNRVEDEAAKVLQKDQLE